MATPDLAHAQSATERACYNAVQGKVAWNQQGATGWNDDNVRSLCSGAVDFDARIACFQDGIRSHDDWQRAISGCASVGVAGSRSPDDRRAGANPGQSTDGRSPNSAEEACYDAVQNRVAWNPEGNTSWDADNIRSLCLGVGDYEARISCFRAGINSHGNWSRSLRDCMSVGRAAGSVDLSVKAGQQCVYNGGGYLLKVSWYDPGRVVFTGGDAEDWTNYETIGTPTSEETVSLGFSACDDSSNRIAVVRIPGADIAREAIVISSGVLTGGVTGVAGVVACASSLGTACPAAAVLVGAAVGGVTGFTTSLLPDAKEIIFIGTTPTNRYLEASRTVFNPLISTGSPLPGTVQAGQSCSANNQCASGGCGRATAADGATLVCCSGDSTTYAGYDYCRNMARNSVCWSDYMCASGNCSGNLGGLQKGRCD